MDIRYVAAYTADARGTADHRAYVRVALGLDAQRLLTAIERIGTDAYGVYASTLGAR